MRSSAPVLAVSHRRDPERGRLGADKLSAPTAQPDVTDDESVDTVATAIATDADRRRERQERWDPGHQVPAEGSR